MSRPKPNETLTEVVCRVLEQTAFLFPDAAEDTGDNVFEEYQPVMATIRFHGKHTGEMSMIVPFELCTELSANMLGEEVDEIDSKEKVLDAFKEILNIITGQMLTEIYGDQAIFNLSPPEIKEISAEEISVSVGNHEYSICRSDDYPIITILTQTKAADEYQSIGG
nr:chemotaxis protein CheX [candidate division Zixibacteria bacterium]